MKATELKNYLVALGLSHPQIKRYVVGDDEEITKSENFQGGYPMIWVESPTPSLTNDQGQRVSLKWKIAFSVITDCEPTQNSYEIASTTTLKILNTLIYKLSLDILDDILCVRQILFLEGEIDEIHSFADNVRGWRFAVPLRDGFNPTSTDIAQLVARPYQTPKIALTNNELSEIGTPNNSAGYSRFWTIYTDGKANKKMYSTSTVTLPATFDLIYAELEYYNEDGNHSLVSSIVIDSSGHTIAPYKNNPF